MTSVLLVTQDLARAGAQRQCVELALGLHARPDVSVEVAVLEPGGALTAELEAAGVTVHVCPRRWRWDLGPVLALAALCRHRRYDVVHAFMFLPNFYTRLARLLVRPPVVISSVRTGSVEGWPRYLAEVLSAPLCDRIISNSEAGSLLMLRGGVSRRRLVVVRNGLDLEPFVAAARRAPPFGVLPPGRWVGMCARMEARADHEGLLRAIARISPRYPEARLLLAGDGSRRARVEAAVERLGLQGVVHLPGLLPRLEALYPALEVYVQASAVKEGTSNSIIEAMAAGRPVVATDLGGNREIVVHGKTGLLVPAHQPEALAEAILALLADRPRARAMGEAGAARAVALYSRDRMIAATLEAYGSLLTSRGGTPPPAPGTPAGAPRLP